MTMTSLGRATAVAATVLLLATGCSSPEEGVGSPSPSPSVSVDAVGAGAGTGASQSSEASSSDGSTAAASATEEPVDPSEAPHLEEIEDGRQAAAAGYLRARETAFSANRKEPSDWLKDARPYMTDEFYEKTAEQAKGGGSPGAEWSLLHDEGMVLDPQVSECGVVTAAPQQKDLSVIQCALTNLVKDLDGKQVPATQVPVMLMSAGPQEPVALVMVREGGEWRVSEDASGTAS